MNIRVIYHSSTGNTQKIAAAIAKELGVPAEDLQNTTIPKKPIDLLFIGDGVYAGKPNKKTQIFISALDRSMVKKAAVFSTYGGIDSSTNILKQLLEKQGIEVINTSFSCKGKAWFFISRKHPTAMECADAAKFAKDCVRIATLEKETVN